MLILDKYQILEEVGRGGMGLVYKAQDVRLGRIVALKELLINEAVIGSERENIISRFKREAQTAASLSHLNIVTIYDAGQDNNRHFIAMEFLKGKNLKDYINENHQFPFEQLLDIFIQTAEGLDHAHSMKIIHRDIKPANVQIIQRNIVKITDFGLAKSVVNSSSLTQDGSLFGTLGYISPEQLLNSKNVDSRADIFSFGAMMYELVTCRLPFEGDNLGASIYNIVHREPFAIKDFTPEIPDELENIILKCLQKDPDKRYQKASEIIIALNDCRENSGRTNQIIISSAKPQIVSQLNTEIIYSVNTGNIKNAQDTLLNINDLKIPDTKIENLKKGQKIKIDEKLGTKTFTFGINWEFAVNTEFEIECFALLLSESGKFEKEENFVFYNNPSSSCNSVKIDISDNKIFKKIIDIDLNKVANDINRIKIAINFDKSNNSNASFININNLSLSVISPLNQTMVFNVEDLTKEETVILAEIYYRKNEWKLQASGEGYNLKLIDFLKLYASEKIEISED